MPTLKTLVETELEMRDESTDDIEAIVIGKNSSGIGPEPTLIESLDVLEEIDGYSGTGYEAFPGVRVWTEDHIYVKAVYEGSEWVASVPRNPVVEHPGSIGGA